MREHESTHLGLTAKEMNTYKKLQSVARDMGILVSFTNNEETRNKFDKAIENLVILNTNTELAQIESEN